MRRLLYLFALFVAQVALCEEASSQTSSANASPETEASAAEITSTINERKRAVNEAFERLYKQPEPGQLINGTLATSLYLIFSGNKDAEIPSLRLAADYQAAVLNKTRAYEAEIAELRAKYDAEMIAQLPAEKQAAANSLLEASRAKLSKAVAREAQLRAEVREKMSGAGQPAILVKSVSTSGKAANPSMMETTNSWIRLKRREAIRQDEETILSMIRMLDADDAKRLNDAYQLRPFSPALNPASQALAQPINNKK